MPARFIPLPVDFMPRRERTLHYRFVVRRADRQRNNANQGWIEKDRSLAASDGKSRTFRANAASKGYGTTLAKDLNRTLNTEAHA